MPIGLAEALDKALDAATQLKIATEEAENSLSSLSAETLAPYRQALVALHSVDNKCSQFLHRAIPQVGWLQRAAQRALVLQCEGRLDRCREKVKTIKAELHALLDEITKLADAYNAVGPDLVQIAKSGRGGTIARLVGSIFFAIVGIGLIVLGAVTTPVGLGVGLVVVGGAVTVTSVSGIAGSAAKLHGLTKLHRTADACHKVLTEAKRYAAACRDDLQDASGDGVGAELAAGEALDAMSDNEEWAREEIEITIQYLKSMETKLAKAKDARDVAQLALKKHIKATPKAA